MVPVPETIRRMCECEGGGVALREFMRDSPECVRVTTVVRTHEVGRAD